MSALTEMTMTRTIELGQFHLEDVGHNLKKARLLALDPCYSEAERLGAVMDALSGRWHARAHMSDEGNWGERIAILEVRRVGVPISEAWELVDDDICVDSGSCGFWSMKNWEFQKKHQADHFYKLCGEATLDRTNYRGGIVLDMGAVSCSGYGDGSYKLEVVKADDGLVVAARLIFIDLDSVHPDDDSED